ncbi:MAG TPA: hypothetical protein VK729_02550 [Silvibacterium sp.]|jgi:hypothetical protein|nr:hypothetical protein [Silvibacterium sp.]
MSSLQFSGVDQGEFVRLSGRQLGSLDQHSLDVLVRCLEIGMRITLSAELFSSPHKPQLMACLIDENRV